MRQEDDPELERRQLERLMRAAASLRPEMRMFEPPSAAEIIARVDAERASARVRQRRRAWMLGGAMAASLLGAAVIGRMTAGPTGFGAPTPTEVVTGPSELATVHLGDGSVVRLAPGTRLGFGGAESAREVTLDGRAFFAVAKAHGEPFTVRTSAGVARVLGTRFELATEGEDLELTVVEGRVALDAPANSVEVVEGERSRVADRRATPPVRVAEAERELDWVGTFLAFQGTPLDEAMREVERTYGVRVTITDSVLARETVTATFTSQPVESVMEVLCSVVSARCTAVGDTIEVSR